MYPAAIDSSLSAHRATWPRVALALSVGIALALAGTDRIAADPGEASQTAPANPPGLDRALQIITKSFRERNASDLAGVLPENGKVFLSLSSFGGGAGYFGRGQVYFILERIFTRHETIRFAMSARGDRAEPREDGPSVVWCLGVWSFRRTDGMDDERQIHFILTCQKGLCHVMEIRDVR